MDQKFNGTTDQKNSTEELSDEELVEMSKEIFEISVEAHLSNPELATKDNIFNLEFSYRMNDIEKLKDILCIVFEFGSEFIDVEVSRYNNNIIISEDIEEFIGGIEYECEEYPSDLRRKLEKNKTNIDVAMENVGDIVLENIR